MSLRQRPLALLVERARSPRPPRWWQEIGFIAVVYFLYSLVRDAVPSHEIAARHRADSVFSLERSLHLNIEHPLNLLVAHAQIAGVHWLAYTCDYYYAMLHFVVTIGVLVWVFLRHPMRYRSIRSVLLIANLVGLLGFWLLPLAPPRMLPGFIDTVIVFHTWGSLASHNLAQDANQFAAMPSLHIAWALWSGLALVSLARRRWVRALGVAYPIATLFVVIGTANHYLLDAVGGAAALVVSVAAQRILSGRRAYLRRAVLLPISQPEPELIAA